MPTGAFAFFLALSDRARRTFAALNVFGASASDWIWPAGDAADGGGGTNS